MIELRESIEPFAERLNILKKRDILLKKRSEDVLNFGLDQDKINDVLDDVVREGLRLYLEGPGL